MTINSSSNLDLLNDVELLDTLNGQKLRLCFSGNFEGQAVLWNATLFTPSAWASEHDEEKPTHNIIYVGDEETHDISINICLQVRQIDRPTVRKTVMMVRQYKRLQRGRHEYG